MHHACMGAGVAGAGEVGGTCGESVLRALLPLDAYSHSASASTRTNTRGTVRTLSLALCTSTRGHHYRWAGGRRRATRKSASRRPTISAPPGGRPGTCQAIPHNKTRQGETDAFT